MNAQKDECKQHALILSPLKQFNHRTCLSGREDGKLLVFFKGSRAWLISLNSAPPRAEDEDRVFRRMMICLLLL